MKTGTMDDIYHKAQDKRVLSAAKVLMSICPKDTDEADHNGNSLPTQVSKIYSSSPHILNVPLSLVSSSEESSDDSLDGNQSDWSERHGPYFEGAVSLHLREDEEALSPLHCFMRKYCVEAFSATSQDIATPRYGKSHSYRVTIGQVGIRCIHCKNRHHHDRQERAVCFPSSLKNIYHSIETWQRRHSLVCGDIPAWIKKGLTDLMQESKSGAGGRRQYWEDSAIRLGMIDTPKGIRFSRKPGDLGVKEEKVLPPLQTDTKSVPVVYEQDRELVTPFLFLLMSQMEACSFAEEDRVGGRSKVKDCHVGFPGMQCKHCRGRAGFGRYFPATVQTLSSANSDRNILNHVTKCRRCPSKVREELQRLVKEQHDSKNRRGSRKHFFENVWMRLHGEK